MPVYIGEAVAAFVETLKDQVRGVRWVRTGHLHLTLKFLGDQTDNEVAVICRAVIQATATLAPFEFRCVGAGYRQKRSIRKWCS